MHTHLVDIFWDRSTARRLGDTGPGNTGEAVSLPSLGQLRRSPDDMLAWPSLAWTEYSSVI